MSRTYSVTEPHPSVAQRPNKVFGYGRGGAGNFKSYTNVDLTDGPSASGPAAASRLSLKRPDVVLSGRGGAGNARKPTEERMFQFDEELVKQRENASPLYHIGRGGSGNLIDERKPRSQRTGSSSSADSMDSERSAASSVRRSMEGALGRLQRKISKQ